MRKNDFFFFKSNDKNSPSSLLQPTFHKRFDTIMTDATVCTVPPLPDGCDIPIWRLRGGSAGLLFSDDRYDEQLEDLEGIVRAEAEARRIDSTTITTQLCAREVCALRQAEVASRRAVTYELALQRHHISALMETSQHTAGVVSVLQAEIAQRASISSHEDRTRYATEQAHQRVIDHAVAVALSAAADSARLVGSSDAGLHSSGAGNSAAAASAAAAALRKRAWGKALLRWAAAEETERARIGTAERAKREGLYERRGVRCGGGGGRGEVNPL